jgi:DNA-binding Xre family transcriptional regulator
MITVTIREQCEKRGITTAYQLQKAAEVSPSVAQKWYSNQLERVEIGTLDKLCRVLKCKPNDLFKYEEK